VIKKTRLFKKFYGCLAGCAIGNTMGSPVENMSYREIEEKYGRITAFPELSCLETEDDLALGQLLCRTYIEKGGRVIAQDYAGMWLREMNPHKYFFCMKNVLELLKMGVPARIAGAGNIVTGSALMAIQPVGLFNACDPDQAYIDAIDISSMYQRGLDVDCAAVMAAMIAEAMKPEASVESILETGLRYASQEPLITFDHREPDNIRDTLKKGLDIAVRYTDIYEVREELYQNVLQYHPIDPLEVLTLTIAIFQVAKGDPEKAVLGGVNIGRDTDTIANLNGSLAGALQGIESLPQEWVKAIEAPHNHRIAKISEDMAKLVAKRTEKMQKELNLLQRIQDIGVDKS
jgi:ADP-ribosylglycohydrolase